MEKNKKEILEVLCCKELLFAFLCIIACVVLFFVRACFPAGTVIRAALGLAETNVGTLAILVLLLSAPPARCWCQWLYAVFVFEAVALAGIAIAAGATIDVVAALNLSNFVMMGLYIVGCIGGVAAMSRKNDKSKKPEE